MTKVLIGLMMLFSGAALAQTLVPLTQPSLAGVGLPARTACVGNAFNADDSIVGSCKTVTSSPCSGRGCQPVTNTTTYVATWDVFGDAIGVTACSVTRHHLPQADTTTYSMGYGPTNCPGVVFNPHPGSVTIVDGVPYYWVATDATTSSELINSNTAGYLYNFRE